MCKDDCLYLLDVKQRQVEVVQYIRLEQYSSCLTVSLQSLFLIRFNKERLTTLNLAVNSNWVFVGTEKGNTHVLRLGNLHFIWSTLIGPDPQDTLLSLVEPYYTCANAITNHFVSFGTYVVMA